MTKGSSVVGLAYETHWTQTTSSLIVTFSADRWKTDFHREELEKNNVKVPKKNRRNSCSATGSVRFNSRSFAPARILQRSQKNLFNDFDRMTFAVLPLLVNENPANSSWLMQRTTSLGTGVNTGSSRVNSVSKLTASRALLWNGWKVSLRKWNRWACSRTYNSWSEWWTNFALLQQIPIHICGYEIVIMAEALCMIILPLKNGCFLIESSPSMQPNRRAGFFVIKPEEIFAISFVHRPPLNSHLSK